MIEEKINNSLKELEEGLKDIESARKQVEKTVSSYDGLTKTTGEYVTKLGNITTKVQELVDSIGKDYDQKIKAFEKDRDTIVNASNAASEHHPHVQMNDAFAAAWLNLRILRLILFSRFSLFALISRCVQLAARETRNAETA